MPTLLAKLSDRSGQGGGHGDGCAAKAGDLDLAADVNRVIEAGGAHRAAGHGDGRRAAR